MRTLLVTVLLLIASYGRGQNDSIPPVEKEFDFIRELLEPIRLGGVNIHISGDHRIEKLVRLNIANKKKGYSFKGYRIQILSASSFNSNVDSLKKYTEDFEKLFPDIPAYLQYFDPDFKIRVGNFHSRLEAIPALKRIRKKYPNSYPVKTDIYLKELNRVQEQDTTSGPDSLLPFKR